jgi:hypothetical protein
MLPIESDRAWRDPSPKSYPCLHLLLVSAPSPSPVRGCTDGRMASIVEATGRFCGVSPHTPFLRAPLFLSGSPSRSRRDSPSEPSLPRAGMGSAACDTSVWFSSTQRSGACDVGRCQDSKVYPLWKTPSSRVTPLGGESPRQIDVSVKAVDDYPPQMRFPQARRVGSKSHHMDVLTHNRETACAPLGLGAGRCKARGSASTAAG